LNENQAEEAAMFKDRTEAGARLAAALRRLNLKEPLLLGIPRGGLVLAAECARLLGYDLDMVQVRKIGLPWYTDLAVGAVDEEGQAVWNGPPGDYSLPPGYLEESVHEALELMRQRRQSYTPDRPAVPVRGRELVVIDDGIATGASMIAALKLLRRQEPARLIAAAAVAPFSTGRMVEAVADCLVVLETPAHFKSVSEFYDDFSPVPEERAGALLREHPPRRKTARP
jgi:predicted phosphoribosyltransferase